MSPRPIIAGLASDDYHELVEILEERLPPKRAIPATTNIGLSRFASLWRAVASESDEGFNEMDDDVGEGLNTRDLEPLIAAKTETPAEVSILLDELAKASDEAKAKGDKAPSYNLCEISVPGTNMFCGDDLDIDRKDMPQLVGKPEPDSPASLLKPNPQDEIDLGPLFREFIIQEGYDVTQETVDASELKASQNELDGVKVAALRKIYEAGGLNWTPLFVSRDNYIVDGHHRWAAIVGAEFQEGHPIDIEIERVDEDIKPLLDQAKIFAAGLGIPQAGSGKFTAAVNVAFQHLAAWKDVQNKARDIYHIGGVNILSNDKGGAAAHVLGDHGTYEAEIVFEPGSRRVAQWNCTCPWAAYSWGRSGKWKKYEGRVCSHVLALMYAIQSPSAVENGGADWDVDPITHYEAPPPQPWRVDATFHINEVFAALAPVIAEDESYDGMDGVDDSPNEGIADSIAGDPSEALPFTEGGIPDISTRSWLLDGDTSAAQDSADIAKAASDFLKQSVKVFSRDEQQALINEGEDVTAANLDRLQLEGTHYEALEAQLREAEISGEPAIWW